LALHARWASTAPTTASAPATPVPSAVATHGVAAHAVAAHACAAPISAADLRALDVRGVVAFVESLGIASADSEKLSEQEIDGAALIESTEDKLRSYGVRGGPALKIMRAIAPAIAEAAEAVAEAQKATANAAAAASAVVLTVYPPIKRGGPNNPLKVRLTPGDFLRKYVYSDAPLHLSKGGVVVKEVMSLEEAVEDMRADKTARLHVTRSVSEDLGELRGFMTNSA